MTTTFDDLFEQTFENRYISRDNDSILIYITSKNTGVYIYRFLCENFDYDINLKGVLRDDIVKRYDYYCYISEVVYENVINSPSKSTIGGRVNCPCCGAILYCFVSHFLEHFRAVHPYNESFTKSANKEG